MLNLASSLVPRAKRNNNPYPNSLSLEIIYAGANKDNVTGALIERSGLFLCLCNIDKYYHNGRSG